MKKLVLTVAQIILLCKVSEAGYDFYDVVEDFLEKNQELSENESVELDLSDEEFNDVIEMVTDYLEDESLLKTDKPTETEIVELKEFIKDLKIQLE